ncbi:MAG: murein DD-endopeptidase MepM/ murein hydrolase activator NlpD [Saprospiraceae bacterium]|jgi:murein DD-endopeptidase MepM/ murein hydrolase activator NlpD
MQPLNKKKNNQHYLITISDLTRTHHFRISKRLKAFVISTSALITFALIVTNIIVFNQKDTIVSTKDLASALEDHVVNMSEKNSNLSNVLQQHNQTLTEISEQITNIERISGVSTNINSSITERLLEISNYYSEKESDFADLDHRVIQIESTMGIATAGNNDTDSMSNRIELLSINVNQEKILHDNIPNGYPTRNLGITSKYGTRVHPTTNQKSFHNGLDLRAKTGTNIYATADGIVKQATYNNLSGKRISLTHNFGFGTRYAHLSSMAVKPGDVVQKGDLIGLSGNSGRSSGPHLHYEVRYLEKPLDPKHFVTWEFGSNEIFTNVRGIQWDSLISLINKQISRPTLQLSQVEQQ